MSCPATAFFLSIFLCCFLLLFTLFANAQWRDRYNILLFCLRFFYSRASLSIVAYIVKIVSTKTRRRLPARVQRTSLSQTKGLPGVCHFFSSTFCRCFLSFDSVFFSQIAFFILLCFIHSHIDAKGQADSRHLFEW